MDTCDTSILTLSQPAPANGTESPPSRPLRICYLIDQLARAGTESQLLALIAHLDRARVEPMLCLLNGESAESRALEPTDCRVHRLGIRSLHRPSTLLKALRFARLLREQQIDLLQVYFPDSTLFGVTIAHWAGVPVVVRTRNNLGHADTIAQRWLSRISNPWVDATVANCQACRQSLLRSEHIARTSVHVLENGVDLARFDACVDASPGRSKRAHCIGMVANLRSVKQPDVLLRAALEVCAARQDVVFRLAGEGEMRSELEREITRAGLAGRFRLVGPVRDVPAFLAEVDVAVLCSRSEGQSNALLEYMAAGRAIVATAVGGNVELIEPEVNGLLIPPGDHAALTSALLRLLKDPELAERLGSAARNSVEQRYSLQARARRFEDLYARLLSARSNAVKRRARAPQAA